MSTKNCVQGAESNRQSSGYEPGVLPLDHPAKALFANSAL